MPELPEVETVRRGLREHVLDRRIRCVEVNHPRLVRRQVGGAAAFVHGCRNRTIVDVRRRGKYLWFALDDDAALVAHLGMSGQFRVDAGPHAVRTEPLQAGSGHQSAGSGRQPTDAGHRHTRATFLLEATAHLGGVARPGGAGILRFVDQRTFGAMWVSPGGAALPTEIAHIGRDLVDPGIDLEEAAQRMRRRRSTVKRAMLDQSLVSGIGNIYADESLWRARLHPLTPTNAMSQRQAVELWQVARGVMVEALEQGGTSFDKLYVNVNGSSGYFGRSLDVYGREGEPCHRCGTPIVRESFMNRSSHLCPGCQWLR